MRTDELQPAACTFLSPPDVRYGAGARGALAAILAGWLVDRGPVLLVGDPSLSRLGHLDQLLADLGDVDVFDKIDGEPDDDTCDALTRQVRSRRYAGVVGMGGGSALDLAKIAASLATSPGGTDTLVGVDRLTATPLPLVAIPTTAGTGSEATKVAMVSLSGRKCIINDRRLVPRTAILDPELTHSLPAMVTASGGLDALSHAVEALLSRNASVFSDEAAYAALGLISDALPKVWADGGDHEARAAMLLGAYRAGLSLNAGTILGHSIAYTIANRRPLPHGIATAIALPYCVAYAATGAGSRIRLIETAVGATGTGGLYTWLATLNQLLGVPATLRELGVTRADLIDMTAECLELYPRPNNPVPLDQDRLEATYHFMWSGDLAGCVTAFDPASR